MTRILGCLCFLFSITSGFSQDLGYARQQIKTLTSPRFFGRGYIKNGDYKAASYLAEQFRQFGLHPFEGTYIQLYNFDVNIFPGAVDVSIDRKHLVPGIDFIVNPASGSCKGSFHLFKIDSSQFTSSFQPGNLALHDFTRDFVMLDTVGFDSTSKGKTVRDLFRYKLVPPGVMFIADKNMIFSVHNSQYPECMLLVKRTSIPFSPKIISVNVKSKVVNHIARNLIGYIPGEIDSFIVFSAHYDHLGGMGRHTYFPGANDNASGTALVLDFIRDLSSRHTIHKYGYVFMLFSGEEAGLLGSQYYASHPVFPLEKIKMVLNFDMVGTGSGGITIFNGRNFPVEFQKLDSLNKTMGLNLVLKAKGTARNSDHYSFQEKKVPALFFNTIGNEVGYHVVGDKYEMLPFTVYERLFRLVTTYVNNY